MNQLSRQQIGRLVRQRLETLQRAGVVHLLTYSRGSPDLVLPDLPANSQTPSNTDVEEPVPKRQPKGVQRAKTTESGRSNTDIFGQPSLSRDQRIELLTQASCEVAACSRCAELAETRTQTVFGVGDPQARLVFLGEAPGADEDRQGVPFVGRAGQLLTKIIEASKLKREDVYILNILKCRPPGNRNPSPTETSNCSEFLMRQLRIIQPEFICCLGAVAAQNLLDTQTPIGRLRGSFHDYHGIKVVATYHPAYLLRNPSAKRHTWDDMKFLMRAMGIDIA